MNQLDKLLESNPIQGGGGCESVANSILSLIEDAFEKIGDAASIEDVVDSIRGHNLEYVGPVLILTRGGRYSEGYLLLHEGTQYCYVEGEYYGNPYIEWNFKQLPAVPILGLEGA